VNDIVNRNLKILGTLTRSTLGSIDVTKEISEGNLSIWLSQDASHYTKHQLQPYRSAIQLDASKRILSWVEDAPYAMAIHGHFYLQTQSGKLMSALSNWPVGFKALLALMPQQSLNLYGDTL
jgi:hypothetical protein